MNRFCNKCGVTLTDKNWIKCYQKSYTYRCKDCDLKRQRESYKKNSQHYNKKKNWYINRKIEALKICGGACICCGEKILDFLTIDHINNDGANEGKNGIKRRELANLIVKNKYDINNVRSLCYNCNCAYGTHKFCSHQFDNVNFNCCSICNDVLFYDPIQSYKTNKPTNFHEFFIKSNINVCLPCIYNKKTNNILKTPIRKKIRCQLSLRTKILDAYGGKCECCGEDRYIFLTIDHIIPQSKKNRTDGSNLYRYLLRNNFPKDNYRILCYNCNCARGHRGSDDICPHKKSNPTLII